MIEDKPIEKINIRLGERADKNYDKVMEILDSHPIITTVYNNTEGSFEITFVDANKGVALAELSNRLGFDREEVMAIGDSENDISMLTFAGTGVSMGQAEEEVKAHADYVTESNDNNGVALAIEKFVNGVNNGVTFPEQLREKVRGIFKDSSEPVVYCYKKCSTCAKALKWLDEHGYKYKKVELPEKRPSEEEFLTLFKNSPYDSKRFFNTSGRVYREMDLKSKIGDMDEKERAKLLSENAMLIRRPLLIVGNQAIPGFREKEWVKLLNGD